MEVSDHSVVGVFIQVDEKFAVVTLASALLSKINYTMLDEIDVLFGAYNLKNEQESHRELSKVRRFVVHPNYRPGEHSFDIAQDEGAPLLCRHLTFHNVFAGIVHIPPSPQEIAITSVYDNADWLRHIIRCR
ncbi:unnamed protein product [Soboliphyme baturini]|uniref:MPN domain-containing protein n=1 Tax=Soboliphyme baturini TaxID=241478 RepID=A0A183J5K6_9BILA|nr:unnamed protein product [Soboliphyme baturini]